jgi:two-component system nitrogen regulation response regulator NtrX
VSTAILIVDDESGIRQSLRALLRDEGYSVDAVSSGEECLRAVQDKSYELVLLDIWLKGMDGLATLQKLKEDPAAPMVIMISGHGNIETAVRATKLGAFDFIEKPLSLEKTVLSVRHALEFVRLEEENRRLRGEVEKRYQILGESIPMKALRQQIALTAPTNGRVLIYGESGTGKELIARALHAQSLRARGPFIEVNCAAIPEELIESELFGHRKGSFTGAGEDKAGKFQRAGDGTIFLDEVADMSLKTQAKVLRVLEQQSVEPVGSSEPITVDVRVIAATNKRLEEEIARGAFREDLFYRLNVIPFWVPPLRDRTGDISVLAQHFLAEYTEAYGRRAHEFTSASLEILRRYPWPGNVRELRNLVERIVIMCPEEQIEPHHLPPEVFRGAIGTGAGTARAAAGPAATLQEGRAAYERDFILHKLEENQWNMTRTAAALGLERSHLYRKMKTLGIAGGSRGNGE